MIYRNMINAWYSYEFLQIEIRKRRSFDVTDIWRDSKKSGETVETANEMKKDEDGLTSLGRTDLEPRVLRIFISSVEHSRFHFKWFLIERRVLVSVAVDKWIVGWSTDISANQNQRCKCAMQIDNYSVFDRLENIRAIIGVLTQEC